MYSDDKTVAAAQKVMLEILTVVHSICVENNITYWLEAGTLLGAVRHKGFIPWDDDCDISMPRKDYERFLTIAQEKLPSNMIIQHHNNDKDLIFQAAKVRRLGTKIIETGETGKENYHHGIYIDIFPYDYYESKTFLDWMRFSRVFRDKKKKYKKGSLKRALVSFYTNVVCYIPVCISVKIREYYESHPEKFANSNATYFTYGLATTIVRNTKKEDILPTVLHEDCFEGFSFYLPKNPDMVLKANYGPNYMTPPPIDKRMTHAKYINVNGEE